MKKGTRVKVLDNIDSDGNKYHFTDVGSTAVVISISRRDGTAEVMDEISTQQTVYIEHVEKV